MQDYKFLRVAVMICVTLVNTHRHTYTLYRDRQTALTGYAISSAEIKWFILGTLRTSTSQQKQTQRTHCVWESSSAYNQQNASQTQNLDSTINGTNPD